MTRPMPIALFIAPKGAASIVNEAERLAGLCDDEFVAITGRKNRMTVPYHRSEPHPICCIGREGNYWTLECNDPDLITDDERHELATRLISHQT